MECAICRGTCLLPLAHAERLASLQCLRCGHPLLEHTSLGCWAKQHPTSEFYCDCPLRPGEAV
jgi:hypothetical protein